MARITITRLVSALSVLMLVAFSIGMKFMPDHVLPYGTMEPMAHAAHMHGGSAEPGQDDSGHDRHERVDCPFCRASGAMVVPPPPAMPERDALPIVAAFVAPDHIRPPARNLHGSLGARAPPLI